MLPHKTLFGVVSEDPTALPTQLAAAAAQDPVYFDDALGMPVILDSSAIDAVLRNEEAFSTRVFANGLMKGALIATAGDAHKEMRKLYNKFFTPRHIRTYQDDIVTPAVRIVIEELAQKDKADLIDDFCVQVPQRVVCALFGLPMEKIAENDALVRTILMAIIRPFDEEIAAAGNKAYAQMSAELHRIAARELDNPSDTMLGEIARALIDDGDASVEACERIVFTLILGSYETTIWGLASILVALLREPEAMARVCADFELLPNAIEESWRWCGSNMGTVRYVEKATEVAGHTFEPGAIVQLGWQAMHFDPKLYPDPTTFDIERKVKTMIFSSGAHYCAGAPLARMETCVALELLLERFPKLRFDPEADAPKYFLGTRGSIAFGPDHLPVLLS